MSSHSSRRVPRRRIPTVFAAAALYRKILGSGIVDGLGISTFNVLVCEYSSLLCHFFDENDEKQQKNIVPTSQIHWTCGVNRGGTLCVGLTMWD